MERINAVLAYWLDRAAQVVSDSVYIGYVAGRDWRADVWKEPGSWNLELGGWVMQLDLKT